MEITARQARALSQSQTKRELEKIFDLIYKECMIGGKIIILKDGYPRYEVEQELKDLGYEFEEENNLTILSWKI